MAVEEVNKCLRHAERKKIEADLVRQQIEEIDGALEAAMHELENLEEEDKAFNAKKVVEQRAFPVKGLNLLPAQLQINAGYLSPGMHNASRLGSNASSSGQNALQNGSVNDKSETEELDMEDFNKPYFRVLAKKLAKFNEDKQFEIVQFLEEAAMLEADEVCDKDIPPFANGKDSNTAIRVGMIVK